MNGLNNTKIDLMRIKMLNNNVDDNGIPHGEDMDYTRKLKFQPFGLLINLKNKARKIFLVIKSKQEY